MSQSVNDLAREDNLVQPFHLTGGAVRGQLVRLGTTIDDILTRHAYPPTVARLTGEALCLTALLSASLKFAGGFTLQAQSDGPVSLLVTDFQTGGALRGMAKFDATALHGLDADAAPSVRELFGKGHLAFTVDQGPDMERYQSVVDLDGDTLADCAQNYLNRSEQLPAAIVLAVDRVGDQCWRAGGMMLQRLPERDDTEDRSWHDAVVLMQSVRAGELLDDGLSSETLLYRLFHESGVWVHETRDLEATCRCGEARVLTVLRSFPHAEVADMADGEFVEVTCEFCNRSYRIHLDEI